MDYNMLSLKTFSLLFVSFTYHLTSSVASVGALQVAAESCAYAKVISDESEARQCLNVTDATINPPFPIILEATVEDDFICKDNPPLYSFSCTLYGFNLVWYFDDKTLTAFHRNDMDRFRIFPYPLSAPYYNITTVLTQVSTATISKYNAPLCVSVLTVQPYNESDIQVLPFTVSCQSTCEDDNETTICQTKHYDVAAKPMQPHGASGSIQAIVDNDQSESSESETGTEIAAIASLNWNPPENHNETAIDFYELTMIGAHSNNTFLYKPTGTMAQQTFSSKYVLPGGNYTAVRITVVDLCEQRSEPSQIMLNNIDNPLCIGTVTTTTESVINPQIDELIRKQKGEIKTLKILTILFAVLLTIIIAALILIIAYIVKCGTMQGRCS